MESWELTDEEIKAVVDTWVYKGGGDGDSLNRAIANAAGKKARDGEMPFMVLVQRAVEDRIDDAWLKEARKALREAHK